MNINEFIGEKAEDKVQRIKELAEKSGTRFDPTKKRDVWNKPPEISDILWLIEYISFLKGNRRANQDGLD